MRSHSRGGQAAEVGVSWPLWGRSPWPHTVGSWRPRGPRKREGRCARAPEFLAGSPPRDWGRFSVALRHVLPLGPVLLPPLAAVLWLLVAPAPGAPLSSLLCLLSFWKEGTSWS